MKKQIKKKKKLNLEERIKIEINYCHQNKSLREIGKILDRHVSTITREIEDKTRHGVNKYEAFVANNKYLESKKKKKKKYLLKNEFIREYVIKNLKLGWSPVQISLRIKIDYDNKYTISYEAIYQYIYTKEADKDLKKYLPRRHKTRRYQGARKRRKAERLEALPSIELRDKEVEKRIEVGHFEDDSIVSRESKDRLKTVNERVTGLVFINKVKDGTKEETLKSTLKVLSEIPSEYRLTLTRDRGTENYSWRELETELNMKIYFAHPYCSHERGSNENTNGLIRRYFPKKTNFSKVSCEEIKKVEYLINSRPRKRLGGLTPYEVYYTKTGIQLNSQSVAIRG